ncbi:MAG: hypothetical protein O3B31_15785, partial [Chloroflexi bacterium]|nr:hypothetical protein [Chloroflexota bacterium]
MTGRLGASAMAYEWHRPSADRLMNGAGLILALWGTRNEIIGWGPPVADAVRDIGQHWGDALAISIAALLVAWAHWRSIAVLVGFREATAPRWANDEAMGNEIFDWMKRRVIVTDSTTEARAKDKRISFAYIFDRGSRPVTVIKADESSLIQVSTRVTPSEEHAASIRGMDEPDYRAMQDDVSLELVKSGIGFIVAERIIPERGEERDEDGDEIQTGVFMAIQVPSGTLTRADFIESVNVVRRALAITQVVLRKHVRIE